MSNKLCPSITVKFEDGQEFEFNWRERTKFLQTIYREGYKIERVGEIKIVERSKNITSH